MIYLVYLVGYHVVTAGREASSIVVNIELNNEWKMATRNIHIVE